MSHFHGAFVIILGLLRRNDNANQFPLGILPLGRTNSIGNTLFPGGKGVEHVRQLIEASMAIIKGRTVWKDAMKIEPITEENEAPSRPIYAMSSIEWGAFRDTLSRREKYWIYGSLREHAAYIFNGYKNSLTWDCSGVIKYTLPCVGCGNCVQKKPEVKRKWTLFMPNTHTATEEATITNPECAITHELCFKTSDLKIKIDNTSQMPALGIILGKNKYSYTEFVAEGWRRLKEDVHSPAVYARTIELLPKETEKEVTIEIDKEDFELKPVKITLLPKVIKLFYNPQIYSPNY